jgi:hypothetical protein
MKRKPIRELIAELSSAIWRRPGIDPSFSIVSHLRDPRGYQPRTADELASWDELTHPDRYEELVAFVNERRGIPANPYALFLDSLILRASAERRTGKIGEERTGTSYATVKSSDAPVGR